jgi:hypothetical protein
MNHYYAHATAGEPEVHLNQHDPARPFAVIRFGDEREFTSHDADYCRRAAQAWTTAAHLLDTARQPVSEAQADADREATP